MKDEEGMTVRITCAAPETHGHKAAAKRRRTSTKIEERRNWYISKLGVLRRNRKLSGLSEVFGLLISLFLLSCLRRELSRLATYVESRKRRRRGRRQIRNGYRSLLNGQSMNYRLE